MLRAVCAAFALALSTAGLCETVPRDFAAELKAASLDRARGHVAEAHARLERLLQDATAADQRAIVRGEMGIVLRQSSQLVAAKASLESALPQMPEARRPAYQLELANTEAQLGDITAARKLFAALSANSQVPLELRIAARLNESRFLASAEQPDAIRSAIAQMRGVRSPQARARLSVNAASRAYAIGDAGSSLAQLALSEGGASIAAADPALRAQASELAARILLRLGKRPEALGQADEGLERIAGLDGPQEQYMRARLEWLRGRLLADPEEAIASFERAIASVESIRQDLPIELDDGKSSFLELIEPLYAEGAERLLESAAATRDGRDRVARAVEVIELSRQSEMQDFLGDRCEVEAAQGRDAATSSRSASILYILGGPRNTWVLLKSGDRVAVRKAAATSRQIRSTALALAAGLRSGRDEYLDAATGLYTMLLAPLAPELERTGDAPLVVVATGALRAVPFAALHDGRAFLVQKRPVVSVAGLSMTNLDRPAPRRAPASLVAGLSMPSARVAASVADRLADSMAAVPAPAKSRSLRAIGSGALRGGDAQQELALPGVSEEVKALSSMLPGERLLDSEFTVDRFRHSAQSGDYRIMHIASHGLFTGNASTSYIMAYDDVITMNGLRDVLATADLKSHPLEILSLSACETAEGDERSPLGIAGVAIRARAKAVVGTLWPVDDTAARLLMERFYAELVRPDGARSKAEAMREAQLMLLHKDEYRHPFFWAPFTVIGNWQ